MGMEMIEQLENWMLVALRHGDLIRYAQYLAQRDDLVRERQHRILSRAAIQQAREDWFLASCRRRLSE